MRRLSIAFLFVAATVLSVPVGLYAQDAEPERTLRVVETIPAPGEEHPLDEPIVFYFNAQLDCASAEDAVTAADEPVTGETTCDGTALTFTPDEPLERGTTVTLEVAPTVRSVEGAELAEPFTLDVTAIGHFGFVSTVPTSGSLNVETDTEITVVFDRPVVPLTTLDEQEGLPQPLVFDPSVEGRGVWIGTSVYQFIPDEALAGGTEYTVAVGDRFTDTPITAPDGSELLAGRNFFFTTQDPAVREFSPTADEADVPLSRKIQVTFNQPMDRASTEEAFFLESQRPRVVPGTFEWNDDDTGFMFAPEGGLDIADGYNYGFVADTALNAAQTETLPQFIISFLTVPLPAITHTYPSDGQTDVRPYGGFSLYFTSKMNPETLLDKVTIRPAPEGEVEDYFSEYGNRYDILFPLEPETEYAVDVAPGMEDVYGNVIERGLQFEFRTGSHDPELAFNIPFNGIGLYDADREATQLYVTHMNVDSVELMLEPVPTDMLVSQLMSEEYYRVVERIANTPLTPIRQWTLPGAELRNVRRLDLVNVGDAPGAVINGVQTVDCPGAMPSRVQVGDRATIITEPEPTRARSQPVDGDILELMYAGYSFPITGGPQCHNGVVWWEIALRQGDTAWVAEGLDGEYFFEITLQASAAEIDVTTELDGGPLPPGAYMLMAYDPSQVTNERVTLHHVMLVSDTALLLKLGIDQADVWATDIHTGTPVAGLTVQLKSRSIGNLEAVTNEQGVATFTFDRLQNLYPHVVAYVDDGERFGITSSDWADGLYPYQFNVEVDSYPAPYRIYMYTDRPVYRPGQPVHYRGIARAKDDNDYTVPPFDEISVTIRNASYEDVATLDLPLNDYGTFSGTFTLDDEAELGYYQIEAKLPVETDNYYAARGSINFDVAEYRLPEFQVTVQPERTDYVRGETVEATIDARYFFGGPVSNADVNYYMSAQPYFFPYEGRGNYQFEDNNPDGSVTFGAFAPNTYDTGTTGEDGTLHVEFETDTGSVGRSLQYTIEANATDESGQYVSGRTNVVVHQGEVYVGVAPREFIGTAGLPLTFDLISVDWESDPVAGQEIDIEVVERRWNSIQELDPYTADIVWKSEVEEIPVASGTVTTDGDGEAEFTFEPEHGGIYKLKATTRDASGNTVRSSGTVWVSGGGFVAWRQRSETAIDLIADKSSYSVGDTAEILIASPFMGRTEALVSIEREGVIRTERLTLESNSVIYELPIEEDFAPTVYVGVTLVKGVDETNPVADMRVGYVKIPVDNERLALTIEITPDTDLAGPRDTVTYRISTTDYTGAPVQAELGVALTDLASLSLGNAYSAPILDFYYGLERLGVVMSSGMTLNTDLITQFTRDVIKGGGGGGGDGFGIIELREEFIDTAFWDGQLETDENGEATVTITLPDNLTTWRMVVKGLTARTDLPMLVGEATDDIIATKPLIVRPVAPRFLVRGDEVLLAAVVNNNTHESLEVNVSLQAEGVTLMGDSSQTVTIPAQGRARVDFPAVVDDVEAVELIYIAEAGEYNDATRPQFGQGDDRLLPVYKYEVPEFVGTGGTLRTASARVESVVLPRRYEVTEGELTIALEPSLAVTTLNGIKALRGVTCECTEYTASRLLVNTAGMRALGEVAGASRSELDELEREANLAIQRLIAQQKVDGGWGWYSTLRSDALVTAWVMIALDEAVDAGLTVDPRVLEGGWGYLANNLRTGTRSDTTHELNRSAIITYVLAKHGESGIDSAISNLFDLRDQLSLYARGLLLLAILENPNGNDTRAVTLRDDLMNAMIVSANGAHWEEETPDYINWNSDTRTTAIVLRALIAYEPDEPLLPNVVRWLMIARRADMWETTQETAWALFALTDWMLVTGETTPTYNYAVAINGEQTAQAQLAPPDATSQEVITLPVSALDPDAPNEIEIVRGAGSGALYYTAYLEAFLPVPDVQPVSNGVTVERQYRLLGEDETITQAHIGDLVEVTVTIIAPNDLNFVVVEDPVPAGTEPIDPGLSTSQQTETDPSLEITDTRFAYWWWADIQFRDEKVVLSTDFLSSGTYKFIYLVRPSVEGTYNVIPATAREFYLPEVYGRSAGSLFTVLPAEE